MQVWRRKRAGRVQGAGCRLQAGDLIQAQCGDGDCRQEGCRWEGMPAASAGRNVVPLLVSERLAHLFLDVIARLRMILKLCRPGATGMKCIPRRTLLLMSPFSGGMIAEAGDNRIPYRLVHFDE